MTLCEADVLAALRARHAPPEWAFFDHVRNSTGGGGIRTVDALALNLWPSRGMELHGFEVKLDRGDWLRELKAPAKADAVVRYCDRFWVVAPEGAVRLEELPPRWGLLRAGDLWRVVEAFEMPAAPLDRGFVCAIARAAAERKPERIELNADEIEARARAIAEADLDRIRDATAKARVRAKQIATQLQKVANNLSSESWEP